MKIQWLGHAAFLVETEGGVRIVMDPYESGSYDGAVAYGPIETTADIVTISHEQHEDHNCVEGIQGNPVVLKGPGRETVKGVEIKRIHTYHDESEGRERGENFVFCLQADGLTLCHLGDLGHLLTEDQEKEIGSPDVLLIPVGGTFTIGPEEASKIVERLRPRVVIPMHYKTPKCAFPLAEVDAFLAGKDRVRREGGSTIEVRADSLPEATEVVVLEPAL